jgi:hypothetical protein
VFLSFSGDNLACTAAAAVVVGGASLPRLSKGKSSVLFLQFFIGPKS